MGRQAVQLTRRVFLSGAATASLPTRSRSKVHTMTHIALLGDSIIDNKAYVSCGPDVLAQLRSILPHGWSASSCARDGAVVAEVSKQLSCVQRNASHLVVSAGGNDALIASGILEAPARSVGEALQKLAPIRDGFQQGYSGMLEHATAYKLPLAVCTIYDPRFPEAERRKVGALALSVLNDCITREAFARNLDVIDLRILFNDDRDFANPIEPSVQGGMKLARAIVRFAEGPQGQTRVIG